MRRFTALVLGAGWLAVVAPAALADTSPTTGPRVVTIDGRTIEGNVVSIDPENVTVMMATGQTQSVARQDVFTIQWTDALSAGDENALLDQAGRHVLVTRDGSRIGIEAGATIADGVLHVRPLALDQEKTLPLDRIAYLLRPADNERPSELERHLSALHLTEETSKDHIVVAGSDGRTFPLDGIVKALDAQALTFHYDDTDALVDATTIRAVYFTAPRRQETKPAGYLIGRDGTRIAFSRVELSADKIRLPAVPAFGEEDFEIETTRVAMLQFLSDRLAYLSDQDPADAHSTGFFDTPISWQKDRACGGGPIRLGGTVYEKGLGLHSRTELAFDLGGQYHLLTALAGIDEAVSLGAAHLTIMGDGRTLLEKTRLDRADPPHALRLDVTGVRRLVILVDFAEGTFGVAGRVDLADAKLIR